MASLKRDAGRQSRKDQSAEIFCLTNAKLEIIVSEQKGGKYV